MKRIVKRTNFILPLIWMALTGEFSLRNLLLGVAISSLVIGITLSPREVALLLFLRRLWQWLLFFLFFFWELMVASLRVVHDILTPRHRMRPAILAIPLDLRTDEEITLLANLLTLTPGSLSLDVSPDRKVLYVHSMYVDDIEESRRQIKEREKRVRKVLQ